MFMSLSVRVISAQTRMTLVRLSRSAASVRGPDAPEMTGRFGGIGSRLSNAAIALPSSPCVKLVF